MLHSLLGLSLGLFLLGLPACGARDVTGTPRSGVDMLKKLHRGELAAVASYEDALAKLNRPAWTPDLSRLRDEHRDAANALADRVRAAGGAPDLKAGAWGEWAELVTKAAAAIGEDPALSALKTGESHGVREYEEALGSKEVDEASKTLIRSLQERQRAHIKTLEALKATN